MHGNKCRFNLTENGIKFDDFYGLISFTNNSKLKENAFSDDQKIITKIDLERKNTNLRLESMIWNPSSHLIYFLEVI